MSFQNDAFSLNFDELYNKYPNRRVPLYRYKVKNYDTTLKRVIIKPRRNVLLLLEEETELKTVQDTYQGIKTTITINSNQSSGSAELYNQETITLITSELIPIDYRESFYIYSFNRIVEKQLSTEKLFLDQLGSSIFPNFQEQFFTNAKDQDQKVTNVLILSKLNNNTAGITTKIYSMFDAEIDYFDANKNITLQLPGPFGEFEVSFYDDQDHKRQMRYKLIQDNNHKYALLNMQPTKIRPEITFSSDTFDANKNINFERARRYIGASDDISLLWKELNYKTDGNDAAGKLYWAFLTIVFLSNQRLTKFKDYRINYKNNPNLGKIDTTSLKDKLYGLAIDDILSVEQKEFNATILKTWEQEFSDDLKDNKLQALYQELKGVLASLTEYIPSPYAYGNYQKIGLIALEWYFVPNAMNITPDNVFSRVGFNVELKSLKYKFDNSKKIIIGITDKFLEVSGVRTFNLDGQLTLPSIPEIFTEENKNTSAGSVDITNTNFLNYTWIFQLLGNSKYRQLFFTDNPFIAKGKVANKQEQTFINYIYEWIGRQKHIYPDVINLPEELQKLDLPTNDNETKNYTNDPIVENYINNELVFAGRRVVSGTSKATILLDKYTETVWDPTHIQEIGKKVSYTYKISFNWEEQEIGPTPNINQTPVPYSINQATWEDFETALGSNVGEYILKPIVNTGANVSKRLLNDIQWKTTFSNFATIKLQAKKKDGTYKEVVLDLEQAFKKDQTISQEGIYL